MGAEVFTLLLRRGVETSHPFLGRFGRECVLPAEGGSGNPPYVWGNRCQGAVNGADRAIARLADRQHGVVTHGQLRELGLSRRTIERRVEALRLYGVHRGVYAVGRRSLTPLGHRMAAVLACGPTAVLSHKSAGSHWGLLETAQTKIDVMVPGTSRAQRKHIRVHRGRRLHPEDVQKLDGIPVTSVARTLLDLAAALNRFQLLRAVEQAERCRRLDYAGLQRLLDRGNGHPGTRRLGAILAAYTGAPATRSELERRFLDLVIAARLPRPHLNVAVAGLEVDAHWPQWRLVVELDSRAYHSSPRAFERDRERDATLLRAGQRVLRITSRRMTNHPTTVVGDIRALAALSAERN